MSNVLLLFAFSMQSRVCFFWSVSLLLDAWMSCSLGQTTWLRWLYPIVFGTKLADTICYSIWPFHWWNGILSEGNVIKMNRTLKIWELFDMGQTTNEVSAFHRFLMHICMQWCIFKYYQLFRNIDQLCCRNNVQSKMCNREVFSSFFTCSYIAEKSKRIKYSLSIYTQCLEWQGKKWILKRCVMSNVLKREKKTKVSLWHLTYSRLDDRCWQSAKVQGAGCRVHSDGSWSPEILGHPGMMRWSQSRRFKLPITQDNSIFLPSASLIDLVIEYIIIFWLFWHW